MFKKNTAVNGFPIGHFIQTADGAAKTTGTPTCKRLLDGTAGTLTNAASYDATAGVWKIDLAAGDMNGDMVGLVFALADCIPISYAIRTGTKLVSDLNDAAEAPSAPTVASAVRTELATELDRLDADVSSRLAEVDYTPPPSVVDVAAAIMESPHGGYPEGSFGNVSEWVPTSQSNATAVRTELATELARLDEDVSAGAHPGDAMALVDDAITAAKFDQSTAHPLAQADTGSTAVARTGADGDTLETLSDEIAGIETDSGSGTGTYTDTVTDGVDPLDNVLVQLSTDAAGANMVYSTHTAANGAFTLRPDPGTYYVWFELAGYSFTQGAQVVVT